MNDHSSPLDAMPRYDRKRWDELQAHWEKKANRRALLPPRARGALSNAGQSAKKSLARTGGAIGDVAPVPVKNAAGVVFDSALVPTL